MGGHIGKNVVIAASLLAAGFIAAWIRFSPYLGTEGAFTDGDRTIEVGAIEALRYAIWDAPEPLPGALNSNEAERAPAVSPDGRQVVFVVGERGLGTDLWVADLDARGHAVDPRPLGGLNTAADELAPAFTADGALLFASNRAGGRGGLDLWRAPGADGLFGAARPLGRGVNTEDDETDPAPTPGSGDVVFASNRRLAEEGARGRRDYDLYVAAPDALALNASEDGADWVVDALDDVNTAFDERDPALTLDGRALLFASDRGASAADADFDLYRATRAPLDRSSTPDAERRWLDPEPLVGVNSAADEREPRPTTDGFALLFARGDRAAAGGSGAVREDWDVWRARSRELVRTPGRPIGWRELFFLISLLLLALLAALAKRWSGLDVIYKAFLISLLVHAALLWWTREVVPESEVVEFVEDGEGTRVRLRIVEDPNSLRAQRSRERAGEVQAQRLVPEASEEAPDAAEALAAAPRAIEETSSTAAESAALERSRAEAAPAPARMAAAAERQAARAEDARRAELNAPAVEVERRSAEAPELRVADAAPEASAAERARAEQREARLDAEALTAPGASPGAAAPMQTAAAAAAVERSAATTALADAPSRRAAEARRAADGGAERAPAVEVAAGERVAVERRAADAAEVALEMATDGAGRVARDQAVADGAAAAPAAANAGGAERAIESGAEAPSSTAEVALGPTRPNVDADAPGRAETARPERDGGAASAGPTVAVAAPAEAAVERRSGEAREVALAPSSAAGDVAAARPSEGAAPAAPELPASEARDVAGGAAPAPASSDLALTAPTAAQGGEAPARAPSTRPTRNAPAADDAGVALRASEAPAIARATAADGAGDAPEFDALDGGLAAASLERAPGATGSGGAAPSAPAPLARSAERGSAPRESGGDAAPTLAAAAPLERSRPGGAAPEFAGPAPTAFAGPERSAPARAAGGVALAAPDLDLADGPARPAAVEAAARLDAPADLALEPSGDAAPLARESAPRAEDAADAPARFASAARARPLPDAPAPRLSDVAAPPPPGADDVPPPSARRAGDWDRTPYQSRTGDRRVAALREYGGSAETEEAVRRGLEYLASRQRESGRWGTSEMDEDKYGRTAIGKSGLAVLAFMGAGHTPTSNTEYSAVVERGLRYLVDRQDPRTGHVGRTNAYSHAIATYAMGEAYALTEAEWLREPLERAVRQILRHQIQSPDQRFHGGWSYYLSDRFDPDTRVDRRWPRVSVTVWQVMALESARLGGVTVEDVVFDRAKAFIAGAWDGGQGAFRYSHDPSRLRSSYPILPGSTPAALFGLSLLGEDVSGRVYRDARSFVLKRAPDGYRFTGNDDFVYRAQANLYFWYYGTLAMFRAGGGDWRRWNAAMKETLLPAQAGDGSWEAISIYAEYAKDTDRDRIYTTCMNVLALEIYYRYFTPLLEVD